MAQPDGDDRGGPVRVEACAKRVRAYLSGALVVDSYRPLLVWEHPYYPSYYLPLADLCAELVAAGPAPGEPSARLGAGQVFDVVAGGAVAPGAARRYPDSPVPELRDAVRLEWSAMQEWLEEDEPVYTHARDPHKRVDILASGRQVRVALDGVTLAESSHPHLLFETSLPARYYLPLADLRRELLVPSDTRTHCAYKGTATYWSVRLGDTTYPDLVWMYRNPLPESQKIAGLACFYAEKVDTWVNGELQDRPHTPFS